MHLAALIVWALIGTNSVRIVPVNLETCIKPISDLRAHGAEVIRDPATVRSN